MKKNLTEMKSVSFQLPAQEKEDFWVLASMTRNIPTPTDYLRKLVRDEIEKNRELIEEAKMLQQRAMSKGDV